MNQFIFIINPMAKNGYGKRVWEKVQKVLQDLGVAYLAFHTEYAGHAIELVDSLARKAEGKVLTIVAVGGDGTLHEVVNGAAKFTNVKVAFIPSGSGNDFSRGFGTSQDPMNALQEILTTHDSDRNATFVDIGKIESKDGQERYFINNTGVGFDATIAYEVNHAKLKKILNYLSLGKLVYVYVLLKELFTFKPATLDITVDGNEYQFDSAWFATVSNQPFIGGGMKISPNASPFDGELDITVVHQLSRIKLLFLFILVFTGKHIGLKEVSTLKGKTVTLKSSKATIGSC